VKLTVYFYFLLLRSVCDNSALQDRRRHLELREGGQYQNVSKRLIAVRFEVDRVNDRHGHGTQPS
jgi:hypothetical protein